ncbi:GTP-binding protein [Georgenia satyanarayanai]|uniref:CobW family GTP-binding protein n=1 Tax=Georgenia satyanarayanai TaxID=860221 RepID=UPI0020401510|nr:GTP-binding protein [Georgenia satyanarayanai]MCM3660623.1 GTP-binding protein [Georgenia satyanarayanai]
MTTQKKIPVTVLTGFLGSGKTTLVNHILTVEHGIRIAVIENEFGDIPIDNALVIGGDEKIIEMSNGCCLCCTARTDLIDILTTLIGRKEDFDRIIIETSGMADPNPVAQTFFVDETIAAHFSLDAIVTLVDAKHIERHLDETQVDGVGNQASDQIAFGDRIVINKVDLVDESVVESVTRRVREINDEAEILTSTYSAVNLEEILGGAAFNQNRARGGMSDWLETEDHQHDQTLSSESVQLDGVFDLDALRQWLTHYTQHHGDNLYRLKGVVHVAGEDVPYLVQGIHQLYDVSPAHLGGTPPERSAVVFIGRQLDRDQLEQGLRGCLVRESATV